jgi:two-component system NtrC family sensor kinase
MLTARADLEDRLAGLDTGVNAYLAKPFAPRELLSTVRSLLGKEAATADMLLNERLDSLEVVAGALAHEINNPLNYIKGALDVVAAQTEELFRLAGADALPADKAEEMASLAAQTRKLFAVAESGIKRIAATVALMRRYSREGYTRALQAYDAFAAARDAVHLVAPATGRGASIDVSFDGEGLVECVPEEVNQVLSNLVQNALEAAPETAGRVRVRGYREREFVVLSVADNGPGIKPEDQAKIFTPFFSTKGPGRGMGMGLTIAQRVVASLGGSIRLRSQVGIGTEFVVRIPHWCPTPAQNALQDRPAGALAAVAARTREIDAFAAKDGYAGVAPAEPSPEDGA